MNKKEKLIQKLKVQSKSFSYEDAKVLLEYLDFLESNKGKKPVDHGQFSQMNCMEILCRAKPHSKKN